MSWKKVFLNNRRSTVYERIYAAVRKIPKGRVATYGVIAKVSRCSGPRQVGYALHAIPDDRGNIPWHRVINAQGKISLPKGTESHEMQRQMLEGEGVVFEQGKIHLKTYLWKPKF